MAVTVFKALFLALALYCVCRTARDVLHSVVYGGGLAKLGVTVVLAAKDCGGAEMALRAARATGAEVAVFARELTEDGEKFVAAAKKAFPEAHFAESEEEICEYVTDCLRRR